MSATARIVAVGFAASVVLLLRCEAIVGDTVPGFTCTGTSLEACPQGQYCHGSGCIACEAQDVCDHYDNDCNGKVDDGPLSDADDDGYSWCGQTRLGRTTRSTSTATTPTTAIHPGATEICDGKDNDCNGLIDDGAQCDNGQSCFNGKCVSACDVDGGNVCGVGRHCDSVTHTCVNNTTVGIGEACTADSECTSPLFCADATVVGGNVLPASATAMCTEPCCSSATCPDGFVCYTPGSGGRYCVDATKLGRPSTLGTEKGGTSETSATRCRSGLLANGRCADACCVDSNCSGGACGYGTQDGHDGMFCMTGTGGGQQDGFCYQQSDCHDNVCAGLACVDNCCGSAKCNAADGSVCEFAKYNGSSDVVAFCWQSPTGSKPFGATCTVNGDCVSNDCYDDIANAIHYCTEPCCVDGDCATGFACRPTPTLPRCVKQ